MLAVVIVASCLLLVGCSAGYGISPGAQTLIGDMGEINHRVVEVCKTEIAQEEILVDALYGVQMTIVKQRILGDLDELLSPSGAYRAELLDQAVADSESDNAMVKEIRLGRMSIEDARVLLANHAQGGQLSGTMRDVVERDIVSQFSDVQELARMHGEIVRAFADRKRGLARMMREMDGLSRVFAGPAGLDGNQLSSDKRLRERLKGVNELIGDDRLRGIFGVLINSAYPDDVVGVDGREP